MLHTCNPYVLLSFFYHPKNIVNIANYEASHVSSSNSPPLSRPTQGRCKELIFELFYCLLYIKIFQQFITEI